MAPAPFDNALLFRDVAPLMRKSPYHRHRLAARPAIPAARRAAAQSELSQAEAPMKAWALRRAEAARLPRWAGAALAATRRRSPLPLQRPSPRQATGASGSETKANGVAR